jgi:cell wall-associated NlpC family hydrolase
MAMSREEVAQLLYETGFRDEDLVAMVAIAGRESSYEPTAHRTDQDPAKMVGDFGLFQINYVNDTPALRQAIGLTDRAQLLDPEMNARAAFYLYQRGGLDPWTAAEGGWTADGDPLYGTDVDAARAAVERAAASGMLGEPFDYPDAALPAMPAEPVDDGVGSVDRFLEAALAQAGDTYITDAQTDPNDPDPDAFDCSELVEWAAAQTGVQVGEASYIQYLDMKQAGTLISVEQALNTPGALLFRFPSEPVPGAPRQEGSHVAISLGDGRTIEASNPEDGVGIKLDAAGRGFNYAALIPGMDYDDAAVPQPPPPMMPPPPPPPPDPLDVALLNAKSPDADVDMLPDFFELKYGLDPAQADTDGDGITDGYELIVLGTKPDLLDTDFDGIADGLEISLGLDPLVFDNPDPGAGLMPPDDLLLDTDGDGLADWGEELAGTRPDDPDSDDDAVLDGDEFMVGTDPLSADS